ncbi:MAG: hypothetical protein AAFV62_00065 [Pseudomonadota bacterium]
MADPIDPQDPLEVLELLELAPETGPSQRCLACGYRQFTVANGMEDLADDKFSVELKVFEESEGDHVAFLEGVSFDEFVHVITCLRCGHAETVFMPPIQPPALKQ